MSNSIGGCAKILSFHAGAPFEGVLICELPRRWKPRFVASRTFMYARAPRGTSADISQINPPIAVLLKGGYYEY